MKQSKPIFTKHLTEEQLYSQLIDGVDLSEEQSTHLHECADCRALHTEITSMLRELWIARRSQPSAKALQTYQQAFSQVQQAPSIAVQMWQALRAHLLLDSRVEGLATGIRSANPTRYRLLYTTDQADVELLVEPVRRQRRLEGEILSLSDTEPVAPALVQVYDADAQKTVREAESDERGRFVLDSVEPGRYQLLITSLHGVSLQIDELEIT